MQRKLKWQCRWSPTLGNLEDTAENVWGTKPYKNDTDPTVFFGLYGLPDFYTMWRHKGRKAILWAGSDIRHFTQGYWLDTDGMIPMYPFPLADYINTYCESWVENEVEKGALEEIGIRSEVCPSFLGKVEDFGVSFKPSQNPKVYTSVSGDNFNLYGWDKLLPLAMRYPHIEFHLYGSKNFASNRKNIIIHGVVPKEQMNAEIKEMQGALRLTEFDGFSEILAKSVLWGQYPISLIKYPHIGGLEELETLHLRTEPNLEARNYYLQTLNKYPWVQ